MSALERSCHVAESSCRVQAHKWGARCPTRRSRDRPKTSSIIMAASLDGLYPVGQISGAKISSVQVLPRIRFTSKSDAGTDSVANTVLAVGVVALAALQGAKLAGSVGAPAFQQLRSQRLPRQNRQRADSALEAGYAQPFAGGSDDSGVLIERPELLDRFLRALEEQRSTTSAYHLVSGTSGAGKTTLMRQACAHLGGGYVLLEAATASERRLVKPLFTRALETALGIAPVDPAADDETRFRACINELERAAAALNAKGTLLPVASSRASGAWPEYDDDDTEGVGGAAAALPPPPLAPRPPILVIDEADRLLLDEGFLAVLQDLAKGWADTGLLRVCFVTCGGRLPTIMRDRTSGWTRASESLVVPGMTRDEAIRFLRAHKLWRPEGEDPNLRFEFEMSEIVELLGDRPVQLLGAARALVSGQSTLEWVMEGVIERMQMRFAKAGLLPYTSEASKPVVNVLLHLCELQEAGGMPLRDFVTRLGHNMDVLRTLQESEVVALVPGGALAPSLPGRGGSAVVLESRAVQYYLRVM